MPPSRKATPSTPATLAEVVSAGLWLASMTAVSSPATALM